MIQALHINAKVLYGNKTKNINKKKKKKRILHKEMYF